MKYKSNRKQVKREMDRAKKMMLEAVGRAGTGYVKANTAVDTGALRQSIDFHVDGDSLFIGSTLTSEDYPIFIEKGTSRMSAQPYIYPGIYDNFKQLKKIAEGNYKL